MLLLPFLNYLLVARGSLFPLCLLHGSPFPISGCRALQSRAFLNNLISCLVCMLSAMQGRSSFTSRVNSAPSCTVCASPHLLLVSCSGYRLFVLCHPDCPVAMASVSMVLHVSYMRSLCKKDWRTGRQMILSAVRHGVAVEFLQFCAGLRVNKRSRITLDGIRKAVARNQWPRWLTNFSTEGYYVCLGVCRMAMAQGAVPSGESTIAVMRADGRKLVHAGLTKPSRLSIADHGVLQFGKLWRSIVGVILWCGWTIGGMPSFGPIQ